MDKTITLADPTGRGGMMIGLALAHAVAAI
jgi:hypothetical protein